MAKVDEEMIEAVARVLALWNPLGERASHIKELDGYRVEAADIIFGLETRGKAVKSVQVVMAVLNEAFDLDLAAQNCTLPAKEIAAILGKK
ncbi:MAG: hypothetical protein H7Y28_14380 [Rhodoferax sp.]|nr:hypothetical protein [Rhodoferax sp.]